MRRAELSVRDVVLAGLLLAIGFVLHAVFPPILAGMKPDFSLMMLFAFILLGKNKRVSFIAGFACGIITALTTTFPGGQVANVVDKLITTGAVIVLASILPARIKVPAVGIIGTIISGTVFLGTAMLIAQPPAPFIALLTGVVLPATLVNTVALVVIYPIIHRVEAYQQKRSVVTSPIQ